MDDDMEMDDEHEHEQDNEQDPIDEPEYDDDDAEQDDDGGDDDDDDDDDMDDDDADADADADDDDDDDQDDADDDDEDDDDDDAASRNGIRPSAPPDSALSAATFQRKVQERRALFRAPAACTSTTLGYHIEPMAAAPHSAHIHALALSLDGQTLLTGGSDGYVRKYDVHATMNGKTMLTQNVRHGFVEGITRGGTLTAFWPHEEHFPTNGVASTSALNPPTGAEKDRLIGVVHSLAVQQDALWGLSGSESGNIHLYGVRHDPGATRHVFRKHKGAVSALALTQDETCMISGGWDRGVHQWDLNTGSVVRSFPGHAGQISSLSFRPLAQSTSSGRNGVNVAIHPSALGGNGVEVDEDEEDKARNEGKAAEVEESAEGKQQVNGDSAVRIDPAAKQEPNPQMHTDAPIPSADGAQPHNTPPASTQPPKDAETVPDTKPTTTSQPSEASTSDPTTSPTRATADKAAPAAASTSTPTPTLPPTADDPTEEELAFEAELNASLGMALDGASTKADGTRPDSVTASATGTTAGGLMVAGADLDDGADDDLFGGDTPPAAPAAVKEVKSEPNGGGAAESDGDDSLFGDGDEDAEAEAEADVEMDAEVDEDDEADGSSDEDMPLAGRSMAKNPSSQSLLVPGTASPALSSAPLLPSSSTTTANASPARDTKPPTSTAAKPPPNTTSSAPKTALPKPAFGGFSIASSYDAPLSTFSRDVMLSTSLSGQVILWDLRCPTYASAPAKGVHSLPLPAKTPPWCQSAIFDAVGDTVYVGRRNEGVDEWDLRMPAPRLVRSLRLPAGSGPVYALAPMPNRRHIVCGSYDNIRLWDTRFESAAELRVPFKIVAGHHGASLSHVAVDASCRFFISASGDRGWMGSSTEAVIIHDVKAL
ncbi:related to Transcription factor SPT8 [Sporisorium reilianum SRZ2]|uniref:Related to Transcription factor SPT8 n=1 Tax=Sporisorium reilianum (strain SRZ2) TaxID=999809 RepID=E6ZNB3_SPORE|nr:related to Transcription factor SPT8 [Sporisorium reilianum SRZ2]